jgi:predicted dienelactone hydrolase
MQTLQTAPANNRVLPNPSSTRLALNRHRVGWRGIVISFSLGIIAAIAPSVQAAERIYVSYGALERSISVRALETYAKHGVIQDEELSVYAQYVGSEQLKQLQDGLQAKADLSTVAIAQFLYTPQGEILLRRLGGVIQSESRLPGFKAIRAGLILASADPEGLTLLNFLKKFPTRGIRIDVQRSLDIVSALEKVVSQTNRATSVITQQAAQAISTEGINAEALTDLRIPGAWSWEKQTITLVDPSRQMVIASTATPGSNPLAVREVRRGRVIPVDIYLPIATASARSQPVPVVVISHGLGSDRTSFSYLAQHLASHGFAVLVPEHPGSNAQQLQALIDGRANEVAEPSEFVDRPLDISYLLDQMPTVQLNSRFQGQLNLKQVGVVGQSFGAYTALALAGAPINVPNLQAVCQSLEDTLNLSLLLQCRALALVKPKIQLHDARVVAAIAINPITSAVFGQDSLRQIQIPTMIVTGNADTVAPALPEQVKPFTWLTANPRYLVLLDQGTHFSTIGGSENGGGALPIPSEVAGPNPAIARRYVDALSVAFFKTYAANQPAYLPYLSSTYSRRLSELPMQLSLINTLTANQLAAMSSEKINRGTGQE